jgi:hypothetical protein
MKEISEAASVSAIADGARQMPNKKAAHVAPLFELEIRNET